MRHSIFLSALFGLACAFCTGISPTQASPVLSGNVTATYFYPNLGSSLGSSTFAVGSTLDCPAAGGVCASFVQPASFLASGLTITLNEAAGSGYNPATFNGVRYSGLTFDDASTITGFTLDTNLAGLTAANIDFTASSIEFNAQGLDFFNGAYFIALTLQTTTSGRIGDEEVPEPLTVTLFGAGLVGMAAVRRRKAKQA